MFKQTPKRRVLFVRSLTLALLVAFGVFSIFAISLRAPERAHALTSSYLNFQARLETAAGAIAPDGNYNVEFKLYSASSGGSALWTEDYLNSATQGIHTANGYLTANLGSVTPFPTTINWDQQLWITMTVRGTGSCTFSTCTPTDAEMSPRLQLTAVPYAFKAGQLAQANAAGTLFSSLSIQAPTGGNQNFVIQDQGATGTYNLLTTAAAAGSYIQLQGSSPGTAQTGNFNISGTGIAGTLQAGNVDTASAGTLNVGGANATTINIATNAVAHTIAIGTSAAAAQSISIGSANSGSSVSLTGGSSSLSVANSGLTITGNVTTNGYLNAGSILLGSSNYSFYKDGTDLIFGDAVGQTLVSSASNADLLQNAYTLSGTEYRYSNAAASRLSAANGGLTFYSIGAGTGAITWSGNEKFSVSSAGNLTASGTINTSSGYSFNSTSGATVSCSGGQLLQNQVVQGGITTGGTCAALGGGGVTSVGTLDGGTANATGATISGSTIYLQSASASFAGLVNIGAQTFAGNKTFNGSVLTSTLDTASAGYLYLGTATATRVNIGNSSAETHINSAYTQTSGSLSVNQDAASTANALTVRGGTSIYGVSSGNSAIFASPLSGSVSTALAIQSEDPGYYNSVIAFGVTGTNATASGIEAFDSRAFVHAPTLNVVSPNESQTFGLSWDGSNTNTYLKTSANNISLQANSLNVLTATNSAGVGQVNVAGSLTNVVTSTTAFSVQNASASVFNVNTSQATVNIGTAQTYTAFSSTGTFLAKSDYATGTFPYDLATADFNGDGKADIVTPNGNANTISVLLGNGDGTFQTKVDYTTGTRPEGVTVGDFNGDGKKDLAVTNNSSNTVSIFLGNGDGTFQTKVDYATNTGPIYIVSGDFNGDGKTDLAVTDGGSGINKVSILLGNGNGTFQTKVDYTTNTGPTYITSGDFNGDGKKDLAVTTAASTVSILLGNGNGTFQTKVDYATGVPPAGVVSGDFNGDSKTDLAVANYSANTVSILLGNGDGTFQTKVDYPTGTRPYGITTADFNGDGKADLATGNNTANTVSILLGNGNGTFQTKVDSTAGTGTASIISGDFNSDGKIDVITANQTANTVSVLLGTTTSTTAAGTLSVTTANASTAGIIIQGTTGQTADMLHMQDASGNPLFAVGSTGNFKSNGTGTIAATSGVAFSVQNASSVSYLNVDTTTGTIILGSAASGNYISITSAGLTAYGTTQHTKNILLTPEFAGAVLDAQSDSSCTSANNGTMTSGYDSTGRSNYYNWTSSGSSQCYDVVVQAAIPSDFSSWSGTPDIEMKTDGTGTGAYALQVIPSSGSDANYGTFVTPVALSTSWGDMATSSLSGTYTAGDYLTIKVRMTSTSGANVKLGNIKLTYNSKF